MIRIPRTQAPPVGTPIDWSNPLTRELKTAVCFDVFAWEATRTKDTQLVLNGNGVIAPAQGGRAYSQTGHVFADHLQVYSSYDNDPLDYKSGFSFFTRFRYTGTTSADEHAIVWSGNTSFGDWFALTSVNDTRIEDGEIHTLAFTAPPRDATGESVYLYLDGEQVGSAVISVETDTDYGFIVRYEDTAGGGWWEAYGQRGTTENPTVLGASRAGAANDGWHGEIYNGLWWGREITPAEIFALHKNEWQIFEPLKIWTPATAGGITITDVNGTESWTDGDTGLVITGTGFV